MKWRTHVVGRVALLLAVISATSLLQAGKPGGKPDGGGGKGPTYRIIGLDDADGMFFASANDINNSGLVVGLIQEPVLEEEAAACWTVENTDGVVTSTLLVLPGDGDAASGVNDLGEIVGFAIEKQGEQLTIFAARYWQSRNTAPLPLPPLPGDSYSVAGGISNDGVVCGNSFGRDGGGSSAVVWRINMKLVDGQPTPAVWGPLELPTLVPAGEGQGPDTNHGNEISDNDADGFACVAGESGPAAVAWTVESLADGTLAVGQSQVLDIYGQGRSVNNSGMVCGTSFSQSETGWEALVWGEATTILDRNAYVINAHAYDINATGVVVGEGSYQKRNQVYDFPERKAVVWPSVSASIVRLEEFLPRESPFLRLDRATAVNDAGMIVGSGSKGSPSFGAFLAIPE